MKAYDPNVSPYLLRPPVSYEQAKRMWAEQGPAHSTELDAVEGESGIEVGLNEGPSHDDDGYGRRRD